MRKTLSAIVGAIALFSATSAFAQTMTITGPSGTFQNDNVTCVGAGPCSFTDNYAPFVTPVGYVLVNSTLSASETSDPLTAISFSSITLNGTAFSAVTTGVTDFYQLLNKALVPGGMNTLVVSGTSGGNAAYSGTLTFARAVPEPATWAMMLVGFGAIGFSMRRRARLTHVPQVA